LIFAEFKINEHITLKLEAPYNVGTIIYIDGEHFIHCKKLLIQIPMERIEDYDEINSIDGAAEVYERSLLEEYKFKERVKELEKQHDLTLEEEFWGHCSNLQAWAENNYDSRLLHSNLAIPLLKKLADVGDPLAKRIFKDELAKRFSEGYPTANKFLAIEGHLDYLTREEFWALFPEAEAKPLKELEDKLKRKPIFNFDMDNHGDIDSTYDFSFSIKGIHIDCLRLRNLEIEELPKSIVNLKNLEILKINNCNLRELPSDIGKLQNLVELNLTHNSVERIPSTIGELKNLEYLILSNNSINKLPSSIGILKSLKTLNLSNNNIISLPDSMGNLTNLRTLWVDEGKIRSNFPESLAKLKNLERQDLFYIHDGKAYPRCK